MPPRKQPKYRGQYDYWDDDKGKGKLGPARNNYEEWLASGVLSSPEAQKAGAEYVAFDEVGIVGFGPDLAELLFAVERESKKRRGQIGHEVEGMVFIARANP